MPATLDLYINLSSPTRRALVQGYESLSSPSTPEFVLRDTVRVRLHFLTVASGARSGTTFDLGGSATINFGAKVAAFPAATSYLFYSNAFVRDASDPTDVVWTADIDLNTNEFEAAFVANAPTTSIKIEVEVDDGSTLQTVAQADAVGVFDVIDGTSDAPTAATPPYPAAPIANTVLGGNSGGTAWQQRTFAQLRTDANLPQKPIPVTGNTTAAFDESYEVFASATFTDPTPPEEGGYLVRVRNGTATIGGIGYAEGVWWRVWHSGGWSTRRIGFTTETTIPAASLPAATASTQGAVLLGGSTATAAATVDQLSQRQVASWFVNDTVTSNRGIVYSNATRQNIAGVPVWSAAIEATAPSASSTAEIWGQAPLATATALSQAWAHVLAWSGNDLIYQQNGATPATDFRRITWANLRSNNAGSRLRMELVVTQGTATAPVLKVANAVVAGTVTDGAGTDPDWLPASGSYAAGVSGYNYTTADHPHVIPILGAMSAGEASTWFATGRLPAWVHEGGTASGINNTAFTNNGGLGGYEVFSGSSATGFTAENTSSSGGAFIVLPRVPAGRTLFVSGTLTLNSGATPVLRTFRDTFAAQISADVSLSAGNFSVAVPITSSATTSIELQVFVSTNSNFSISNLVVRPSGALTIPGAQGIGTARDLTTLGGTQPNQGRLVGVRPVLTGPAPRNIATFPLSTTGAFLTLGSGNPLAYTPQRIMRAEVIVDTAGADLTFRRNSSSTNDIVTALTDIPSANTATALTLIAAQTRLAPNETVWGSLSAGTGFLVVETADTL